MYEKVSLWFSRSSSVLHSKSVLLYSTAELNSKNAVYPEYHYKVDEHSRGKPIVDNLIPIKNSIQSTSVESAPTVWSFLTTPQKEKKSDKTAHFLLSNLDNFVDVNTQDQTKIAFQPYQLPWLIRSLQFFDIPVFTRSLRLRLETEARGRSSRLKLEAFA